MEKLRIGVFGTKRGSAYLNVLSQLEDVKITAICDRDPSAIERGIGFCPEDVKVFADFDEFINSGLLDGVVLCNYFNEHAPYAVKALEKGIPVLSETTAASTMKECVELCRAVERTGTLYCMAENYPHMKGVEELKRRYDDGSFGHVIFAEGEYVHPMTAAQSAAYAPEKYHWRKFNPRTYYSTHSLAPLMYITGCMPKRVIGKTVFDPEYSVARHRYNADNCGIMLVEMDNGSLFRVSGSCSFGPHGNWYRLGCTNGGIETVRGNESRVRAVYNSWEVPEGRKEAEEYEAAWQTNAELADKAAHGGGDFWVNYNFVRMIRGEIKPYFDCYRAAAMSAVAILGWQSVLNDGKQFDIPDFRDEEQRRIYENDDRDPYPREDKPNTIPYNSKPWTPPYPIE